MDKEEEILVELNLTKYIEKGEIIFKFETWDRFFRRNAKYIHEKKHSDVWILIFVTDSWSDANDFSDEMYITLTKTKQHPKVNLDPYATF